MPRIRLLMAGLPPLLRDVVSALAAEEPRLHVVARVGVEADLEAVVEAHQADIVMTRAVDSSPTDFEALLLSRPRLRLFTVAEGGRVCYVDRLIPSRTVLRDVSPDELMEAILDVGPRGPAPVDDDG